MDPFTNAYIRQQVRRFLQDRCTIENQQEVKVVGEPATTSWVQVAADVPCRLIRAGQQSTDESEAFASQDTIEERYRLILEWDVDLEPGYRVTVGSEVFQVVSLDRYLSTRSFRSMTIMKKAGADG